MARFSHNKRGVLLLMLVASVFLAACQGAAAVAWPGLALEDDLVYFTSGGSVLALDGATGDVVWQFPEESNNAISGLFAAVTVGENILYATGHNSTLYALEKNGLLEWESTLGRGELIGSATIGPDAIYVPSADGSVYAVEPERGEIIWTYTPDEDNPQKLWAAPLLLDNDTLLVPSLDHHLYAVDALRGEELWRVELAGSPAETPVLVDGRLYTGTLSRHTYALNPADGSTIWDFEASGWVWGTPAIVDGIAFFGDLEGTVYAVNANSGEDVIWETNVGSGVRATPLVTDDFVYVGTDSGLLINLDRETGVVLDEVDVEPDNNDRLLGNIVLVGDTVVVAPSNRGDLRVHAFETIGDTGRLAEVWLYDPDANN